jgi:ethanolamine utilization protein EutA
VVRPAYELGESVDAAAVAAAVRRHLVALDAGDDDVALALSWDGLPRYDRLFPFAQGVPTASPPASPTAGRSTCCSTATSP